MREALAKHTLAPSDRLLVEEVDALHLTAGLLAAAFLGGEARALTSSQAVAKPAVERAAKAAPERVVEFAVRGLLNEQNTVRVTAAQVLEKQAGDEAKEKLLMDAYRNAKPESRDLILRVLRTWNDKKQGQ